MYVSHIVLYKQQAKIGLIRLQFFNVCSLRLSMTSIVYAASSIIIHSDFYFMDG